MDGLISLSFDLQVILVAGFLGYKIASIGRGLEHSTEEFLFQTLVFGSAGRALAFVCEVGSELISPAVRQAFALPQELRSIAIGTLTVIAGVLAGVLWRKWGNNLTSALMNATGTHKDDHEASTWSSVMATKSTWTYVQLHLSDGRVLESLFDVVPRGVPGGALTLNDDGVALYVTSIYGVDGVQRQSDICGNAGDFIVTYVPRAQISQVDIAWR